MQKQALLQKKSEKQMAIEMRKEKKKEEALKAKQEEEGIEHESELEKDKDKAETGVSTGNRIQPTHSGCTTSQHQWNLFVMVIGVPV